MPTWATATDATSRPGRDGDTRQRPPRRTPPQRIRPAVVRRVRLGATAVRLPMPHGSAVLAASLAVVALALLAYAVATLVRDRPPGDGSADAGFARDMAVHHAQAVEMASIVYRRTQDPVIETLAFDILTTQQAQIGMMQGWLDAWGLPSTGNDPPMAWMGDEAGAAAPEGKGGDAAMPGGMAHEAGGRMPGLATAEEVASLKELPPAEMDAQFLRLMIRHHRGGVDMAKAARTRAGTPHVRDVARWIATGQEAEIQQMERLLHERS
ncbi:MAG: hypothetical protein QOF01_5016 [Thermomicrobiales bacterium]|nr:hypothetical protein [Thermomicrobiales bacterium]